MLLAWLIAGCAGFSVATPTPTTIVIAGATSMRPVLRALTEAFSRQYPDTLFDLRGGGSLLGEEQARAGQVTLAASVLLAPRDPATNALLEDGLRRVPIGLDGIAVVVHPTNDVAGLSLVQLRDLYAGTVLDWVQLGDEGEVLLVSREEGSGSRVAFEARVMGESPVSLAAVVMPTSIDVVTYVSQNPHAIGYVSRAFVRDLLDDDPANDEAVGVRVVPVEGMLPLLPEVKEQRYPLITPLYLVSRDEPQGRVRQFLDFVASPAGQAIVAQFHAPIR